MPIFDIVDFFRRTKCNGDMKHLSLKEVRHVGRWVANHGIPAGGPWKYSPLNFYLRQKQFKMFNLYKHSDQVCTVAHYTASA